MTRLQCLLRLEKGTLVTIEVRKLCFYAEREVYVPKIRVADAVIKLLNTFSQEHVETSD